MRTLQHAPPPMNSSTTRSDTPRLRPAEMIAALLLTLTHTALNDDQCGADPGAPICQATDTCCMDSPGCTGYCSECCTGQSDFCVLPRPGFLTSTCCPKWTVGCSVGSVGCCDPARPWQLGNDVEADEDVTQLSQWSRRQPNRPEHPPVKGAVGATISAVEASAGASKNATGYAIFTEAMLQGLSALKFDAGSLRQRRMGGSVCTLKRRIGKRLVTE